MTLTSSMETRWPQHRDLNPYERAFLTLDRGSPFAVVLCATVTGTLSPEAFAQALGVLQRRHWTLNVSIDVQRGRFVMDADAAAVVQVTHERDPDRWIWEAEAFMNVPYDLSRAPLVRVHLLQRRDSCDVVLGTSHIISDGRSAACLLRDALELCSKIERREPVSAEPAEDVSLSDEVMPPLGAQPAPDSPKGPAISEREIPVSERWTKIAPVFLSSEQSAALLRRCRSRGVSVNSFLAASMIRFLVSQLRQRHGELPRDTIVKASSGVDLRPCLTRSVPTDQLAQLSGFAYFLHEPEAHPRDLSHLAAEYHAAIRQAVEGLEPMRSWRSLARRTVGVDPASFAAAHQTIVPYAIHTNLGNLAWPDAFGDHRLERLAGMTPMSRNWRSDTGLGEFVCTASSETCIVLHYLAGAYSTEEGFAMARRYVAGLLED